MLQAETTEADLASDRLLYAACCLLGVDSTQQAIQILASLIETEGTGDQKKFKHLDAVEELGMPFTICV